MGIRVSASWLQAGVLGLACLAAAAGQAVTVDLGPVLTESVSDPLSGNSGSNCPTTAPAAASAFNAGDPIMTVWLGLLGLTPQDSVLFAFSYNGTPEPTLGWNYTAGSFQSGINYLFCPSVGTASSLGVWGQAFASLFPIGGGAGSWTLSVYINGSTSPISTIPFTILASSGNVTPAITSVTTAYAGAVIAQNDFIVIKGTNLVPATTPASGAIWNSAPSFASGLMPTELRSVSVTVNNKSAFVYFYCSAVTDPACPQDQLNILTPLDNTIGSVPVVVTSGGVSSPSFTANLQAVAPSFLLLGATEYIAAIHGSATLVGPTTLYPGSSTPAVPGETIALYAVGFGLPTTPLVNGSAIQSGFLPTLPVCKVGGTTAAVPFAGLTSPGLYQLNLTIPATAANGDNVVSCTYDGSTTPAGALITVQSGTPTLTTLTVTTSGTGSGTVSSSPAGSSCGSGCLSFAAGTVVTLTATAATGSTFAGWSGACSGTGSCILPLNSSQAVTATFNLTVSPTPTITSLGATSAQPFSVLTINGSGFDSSAMVNFSWTGNSVPIPALPLVVSSTSLNVSVPPLFNGTDFVAGTASVTVQQASGQSNAVQFQISAIPPAPPSSPGTVTLGFLQGALDLAQGLTSDPSAAPLSGADAEVISALNAVIGLIQAVVNGTANSANLGTVNGSALIVGTAELTQIDRLLLAVVNALAGTSTGGGDVSSLRLGPFPTAPLAQAATSCSSAASPASWNSFEAAITSGAGTTVSGISFNLQYLNMAIPALSPQAAQVLLNILMLAPPAVLLAPEGALPASIVVAAQLFELHGTYAVFRNAAAHGLESNDELALEIESHNSQVPEAGEIASLTKGLADLVEALNSLPATTAASSSLAVACLSQTNLDFGTVPYATTSAPQMVTLTNTGSQPLMVTGLTSAGPSPTESPDFDPSSNCTTVPPNNGSCAITITFKPSLFQAESAAIVVSDNAPDSPQVILMSGTGVPTVVCPDTTTSTCGGTYNLTVGTAGTGSGSVVPSPAGTSCGTNCWTYPATTPPTVVTLTATASSGSTFTGWSVSPASAGSCPGVGSCTVTMNSNVSVSATFSISSSGTADSVTPSITLNPVGGCPGGSVSASISVTAPAGVTWSANSSGGATGYMTTFNVSPTSGTGSGTVNVTFTAPPQSPTEGFTCSSTYSFNYSAQITFSFSNGNLLPTTVYYTYILVN